MSVDLVVVIVLCVVGVLDLWVFIHHYNRKDDAGRRLRRDAIAGLCYVAAFLNYVLLVPRAFEFAILTVVLGIVGTVFIQIPWLPPKGDRKPLLFLLVVLLVVLGYAVFDIISSR